MPLEKLAQCRLSKYRLQSLVASADSTLVENWSLEIWRTTRKAYIPVMRALNGVVCRPMIGAARIGRISILRPFFLERSRIFPFFQLRQHLPLSGRQGLISGDYAGIFGCLSAIGEILLQGPFHPTNQRSSVIRFGITITRTLLHRTCCQWNVAASGDEDDRYWASLGLKTCLQFESALRIVAR